jgi:hypothetical protein
LLAKLLQGATLCCEVLPRNPRVRWDHPFLPLPLPGTGCCKVPPCLARCCKVPPCWARCCNVLPGWSRCCEVPPPGAARCRKKPPRGVGPPLPSRTAPQNTMTSRPPGAARCLGWARRCKVPPCWARCRKRCCKVPPPGAARCHLAGQGATPRCCKVPPPGAARCHPQVLRGWGGGAARPTIELGRIFRKKIRS